MKICLVRTELFYEDRRTDGQTDMTKLVATFRNFANGPKNQPLFSYPNQTTYTRLM
jgi:hypothetical protein